MEACSRSSLRGVLGEELEDVGQGEAVLLGERDVDAVVGGGGLQLEVEAAAEALPQRQAPGLVDAAAEGSVEDELLASAIVEEALGDDGGFGGDGPEGGAAGDDVSDELHGQPPASMQQFEELLGGSHSVAALRLQGLEPGEVVVCRGNEGFTAGA